jgi:hypothetical protein
MGEIAEMMLDGTLCQGCGVYLRGKSDGIPRCCHDCKRTWLPTLPKEKPFKPKVKCSLCERKLKPTGLADHKRDFHGIQAGE